MLFVQKVRKRAPEEGALACSSRLRTALIVASVRRLPRTARRLSAARQRAGDGRHQ
jgi:hypothetical protein